MPASAYDHPVVVSLAQVTYNLAHVDLTLYVCTHTRNNQWEHKHKTHTALVYYCDYFAATDCPSVYLHVKTLEPCQYIQNTGPRRQMRLVYTCAPHSATARA